MRHVRSYPWPQSDLILLEHRLPNINTLSVYIQTAWSSAGAEDLLVVVGTEVREDREVEVGCLKEARDDLVLHC
jgi:hypothetical protein